MSQIMADIRLGRFCGLLLLLTWLAFSPTAGAFTWAGGDRGATWLEALINGQGDPASPLSSQATNLQAASELADSLAALGRGDTTAAVTARNYVLAAVPDTTESFARKLIAAHQQGAPVGSLVQQLSEAQDGETGGFASMPGWQANSLDTAYSLYALAKAGLAHTDTANLATQYLLSSQQPDGSWSVNESEVPEYVTALALRALHAVRRHYDVSAAMQEARNWLTLRADQNGLWADPAASGLVLSTIIPLESDVGRPEASLTLLAGLQLQDGSFEQDAWVTAWILKALQAASLPKTNPDEISITGRVVDSQSRLPLAGTGVEVNGTAAMSGQTSADGRFTFRALPEGGYSLAIDSPGYLAWSTSTYLRIGSTLDLGDIELSPEATSTTAIVRGTVTDATTGAPLEGATVSVDANTSATTNGSGSYQISGIAPGSVVIAVSAPGYMPVTGSGTAGAGGVLLFSPALEIQSTTSVQPAAVLGTVIDAATGLGISGATISVTGASSATTLSDDTGNYLLASLGAGLLDISIAAAGYDSVRASVNAAGSTIIRFSPVLYPSGASPSDANTSSLSGRIVSASSDVAIQGATVRAEWDGNSVQVTSGTAGEFSISGITADQVTLHVEIEGFDQYNAATAVPPLTTTDVGDIRLRPIGVMQFKPDLVLRNIVAAAVSRDYATHQVSGRIGVTVANTGTRTLRRTAGFKAYLRDASGVRVEVGSIQAELELPPFGEQAVELQIAGVEAFRDAPIEIEVDPDQEIPELVETNNTILSCDTCRKDPVPLSTIEPVEYWRWNQAGVISTPVTGPLLDTNGDGTIDRHDRTAVVVMSLLDGGTVGSGLSSGVVRAVWGDTGEQIWAAKSPFFSQDLWAGSAVAMGDLDRDGRPEIIAFARNRLVMAFDNQGQFLWVDDTPPLGISGNGSYGHASLADIDGDGYVEILTWRAVFNHDGSVRWNVPDRTGGDLSPIAANLDADPALEVVIGGYVYDTNGTLLWKTVIASASAAHAAIGNTDDDPEPEVVFRNGSILAVYEHNGVRKWFISNAGSGAGQLLLVDVDGDGKSEIAFVRYDGFSVFSPDGSMLWTYPGQDNSGFAAATAFDFDGDGRIEFVYHDEVAIRIIDGLTGTLRSSIANTAVTAAESSVVADIDGDGRAELIAPSDKTVASRGLRVFKNAGVPWMPTRAVVNQFGSHITNVDDDGRIPRLDQPWWQQGIGYRHNELNKADPEGRWLADLTVGDLRLMDGGAGQPVTLVARVGNAGLADMTTPGMMRFFLGDPAAGAQTIGEVQVQVPALGAGAYADVSLPSTSVVPGVTVYVAVEYGDPANECNLENNGLSLAVAAANQFAEVNVSVDKPVLGPNDDMLVTANVRNTGALDGTFSVRLWIADAQGIVVDALPPTSALVLPADGASALTRVWNSGQTLVGDYQVIAEVYGADGALLARKSAGVRIDVDPRTPVAAVTVATDKPVYNTTDALQVEGVARNLSANLLIRAATVNVMLLDGQGQALQAASIDTGDLPAGSLHTYTAPFSFSALAEGGYVIRSVLRTATGVELAVANTSFAVVRDLKRSLTGSVVAESESTTVGDTQTCRVTLRNVGDLPVTDMQVRQLVRSLGSDAAEHVVSNQTVTIAAGGSVTFVGSFSTAGYAAGDHACAVQYLDGDRWTASGYDVFAVTVPPVDVDVELDNAGVGRVLVLMDASSGANAASCPAVATLDLGAYLDMPTDPATTITVALKNAQGVLLDQETLSLADYRGERDLSTGSAAGNLMLLGSGEAIHAYAVGAPAGATVAAVIATPAYSINTGPLSLGCGGDPLGQGAGDPNLHVQRRYLEATLDHMGWSYLIVDNAERFDWALRNGAWSAVALMSENVQLSQATQIYLGERVAAGTGLLVAGRHDNRNALLDDFLGVWFAGKHASATGLDFAAALGDASHLDFVRADKPVRVTLNGATMLATITGAKKDAAAITEYRHGRGMALHVGHDLLAEAASNGAASGWKAVITALLNRLIPAEPIAGSAWPVTVTIANEGQPANTRVTVELPPGVAVVDASGGTIDGDWQGEAYLPAQGTKSWQLWVALPDDDGNYLLEATVQAQAGAQWLQTDQASLSVTVP